MDITNNKDDFFRVKKQYGQKKIQQNSSQLQLPSLQSSEVSQYTNYQNKNKSVCNQENLATLSTTKYSDIATYDTYKESQQVKYDQKSQNKQQATLSNFEMKNRQSQQNLQNILEKKFQNIQEENQKLQNENKDIKIQRDKLQNQIQDQKKILHGQYSQQQNLIKEMIEINDEILSVFSSLNKEFQFQIKKQIAGLSCNVAKPILGSLFSFIPIFGGIISTCQNAYNYYSSIKKYRNLDKRVQSIEQLIEKINNFNNRLQSIKMYSTHY